jgi:hypothetical protein
VLTSCYKYAIVAVYQDTKGEKQVINQSHKRIDHGVIVRYEVFVDNNTYIVEIFRKRVTCSACMSQYCKHAQIAERQEYQYLEAKKRSNQVSSCILCGRLAKKFCGVAICATCSN